MKRSLTLAALALSLAVLIGGTSPSALAQPGGGKTLIMALDPDRIAAMALVFALAASIYPAARASQLDPVEGLRRE